jgi:hypothetical protein
MTTGEIDRDVLEDRLADLRDRAAGSGAAASGRTVE